ncbi:MAG: ATP synthase F1 subunit delta [Peptococcaceae bacterium]|jgi:ATP synthase F1 delta subunit|nr:ATP synthase F1 subunit delta [Peptococcaceae bacterium]
MTVRVGRNADGLLRYAEEQDKLGVKVYSAVTLSAEQQAKLESKMEKMFDRKISMTVRVDPSLLGGLRIIAGHTVIDNTIKTRLADMKKNIYRGVFR